MGLEQKQPFVKARNGGCSTSCKRGTANRWQIDGNVVSEQAVGGLVLPSCSIRNRASCLHTRTNCRCSASCSVGITLRSTATAMRSFGLSPLLIVRPVFGIKTRSVDAAHACSASKSSGDGSAARRRAHVTLGSPTIRIFARVPKIQRSRHRRVCAQAAHSRGMRTNARSGAVPWLISVAI